MHFSATLIAALASGALALPGGYGEKALVYDAAKATSCTEEQAKQTYPPSKDTYDAPPPKHTYSAPSKETSPAAYPVHGDGTSKSQPVYNPGQPRPTYPWSSSVSTYAPSKPTSGPVYSGDDEPVYDPVYPGNDDPVDDGGEDGGDIPEDGGDVPEDGGEVPDDGGEDGGDVPEDGGDVPEDGGDVPEDGGEVPDEGGDPIDDPVPNDNTGQATQCGTGNAVSCCNSANSNTGGLLGNILGGSCSIQIPVLAGALGNGCNAGNTFCCPTNQNGSINIALPCIPINL